MFEKKIKRIQEHLKTHNLDRLLLGNFGHQISDDLLYYIFLRHMEYGFLNIPAEGKPVLYTIAFEISAFSQYADVCNVLPFQSSVGEIIKNAASQQERIAFRPSAFPVAQYEELKKEGAWSLIPLPDEEKIISIKSEEEIAVMQRACEITDTLFSSLLDTWSTFASEEDARRFLLQEMTKHGVEPSFPPIIASGPNAAHPHHIPTSSPFLPGFCVIDMGVRYQGYCSDMTRTIFIGEPTQQDRVLYNHILSIQEKTIEQATAGTSIKDLDQFCRDQLGNELNKEFIHALGHGLGTQVHERPSVSGKSDIVLETNMVITIEPGVYHKNLYGIRIEDDIVITATTPLVLTQTTKQLLSLPL